MHTGSSRKFSISVHPFCVTIDKSEAIESLSVSVELKWIEISSKFYLHNSQITLLNIILFAVIVQTTDILNVSANSWTELSEAETGWTTTWELHRKQSGPKVGDGLTTALCVLAFHWPDASVNLLFKQTVIIIKNTYF